MKLLHLTQHRPPRRGFTLVELLVVIGIIAVLIGILLPTLTAARKHAATVKCLSNLRQIGMAFNLYANFYRDAFPVVRQDIPDDGNPGPLTSPPTGTGPLNQIANVYYTDMLMPFVSKTGKMNFQIGNDKLAFEEARKTVLWGCTEWEGWRKNLHFNPTTAGSYVNDVIIFDSGYAMSFYPQYTADYPRTPTQTLKGRETQMRTTVFSFGSPAEPAIGKYYKRSQWTKPGERLLMVDANLWYLGFFPTIGQIQRQNAARVAAGSAGQLNIDRYRHGKYPRVIGSGPTAVFDNRGGKVAFNVLFVDGHATTLFDIRDGYKAIRMRYPGP